MIDINIYLQCLIGFYIIGAALAYVIIDDINDEEATHNGDLFIPLEKAFWSWGLVLYACWVFIHTIFRKRK